jgi:peptide/nickel transport system substrate-binding protein
VGIDADALWFNLKPGARQSSTAGAADGSRAWVQRAELRRAISCAVDRQAFANTVFLGAAEPVWGPITAANQRWYVNDLPRCEGGAAEARRWLAALGLDDHDGDGMLDEAAGRPARLTVMTQKGNTALERGAAVVRDDCAKVGLGIDVVPLEAGSLIDRLERGDYEAVYFRFLTTDLDPALNLDFWLSRGGAHVWNPAQAKPATEWEARIDDLMRQQVATLDHDRRRGLFTDVQRIFAAELPVLYFAAPRVYVATSSRVLNATPTVMRPMILWNPDTLAVRPSPVGSARR